MSNMWRRAVRLARSNLNDLTDRAVNRGRGRALADMTDEELAAELERRRREAATRGAVEEATRRTEETREGDSGPDVEAPKTSQRVAALLEELPPKQRRELRQYYANLELPYGADLEDVKQAYRRLMRQYHPDKHQADPARRQLATQLSQKLTNAYNELSRTLKERKP
jgi:DnaJ-domain-containing protein 1